MKSGKGKKLMAGYNRVGKVCSGVACAGEFPGMGGFDTGESFKANVKALAAYRFNMPLSQAMILTASKDVASVERPILSVQR
jgi:hypothetical protein